MKHSAGLVLSAILAIALVHKATAEAPPEVLVKPVAICTNGKCVMSEKDFRKLQEFHAERLRQLQQAQKILNDTREENTGLWALINRLGSGCGRQT